MSRAMHRDDDRRLIDLCTECKRTTCNGDKCDEYRKMEKAIENEERGGKKRPGIEMEPLSDDPVSMDPERRKSGEHGLRLYNRVIDMLEDLKEESDEQKQCQIETMIKAIRRWRMETFETYIDWYAMEGRI